MSVPDWLPGLEDTDGDWDEVVQRLYGIFETDFKKGRPTFDGIPIWWEWRCEPGDPYEDGFWHLIARDGGQSQRLFDPPRAQRIRWCLAVIQNSGDPAVSRWDFKEGSGRVRTYLWLREHDYVVIMERKTKCRKHTGERFDIYDLITAFHVDGDDERLKLLSKHDRRQ
jgi:hypothetical protein